MGNSNSKPVNIFIINNNPINGLEELFPELISRNDEIEKRRFDYHVFKWNAIIYTHNNIDHIMELISTEIKNIKKNEKIQNNIIIAKDINTNFFNNVKVINSKILDIKAFIIYISQNKLENFRFYDKRIITNIYGNRINDRDFLIKNLKETLILKDCYFNQRTNEFKKSMKLSKINISSQYLNIVVLGPSRAGKSTLCNILLDKMEAIESSKKESQTLIINEYSNDYFHIFDTPGLTITNNKSLGNTCKQVKKGLKSIISKVDDSKDDIHIFFYVTKYGFNDENSYEVLQYIEQNNKERKKKGMNIIPIIFIFNEPKKKIDNNQEEEEEEEKENTGFEEEAKSLKNFLNEKDLSSLYIQDFDDFKDEDEDCNIIRVDIKKDKNGLKRILKKMKKYIKKNNPLSDELFQNIQEVKIVYDDLNQIKQNRQKLNSEEEKELKKCKLKSQDNILKISRENSFFHKIYSLENILESTESEAKLAISICCITTFASGFIPIPFLDIPAVYFQQALMILSLGLIYGFSIDEIPFKGAIGSAFGVSVGIGGSGIETVAHVGINSLLSKSSSKTAEKSISYIAKETVEIASKKITEKAITSVATKKISGEIIKEGGEILGKEITKKIVSETGEEIGKRTSTQVAKEIAEELVKQSGKKTATANLAETSKFIPIIGTIIGGAISGSINLGTSVGMGLSVRKFFRYLVCLNAGSGYILSKKENIDRIFSYIERRIEADSKWNKVNYIEC